MSETKGPAMTARRMTDVDFELAVRASLEAVAAYDAIDAEARRARARELDLEAEVERLRTELNTERGMVNAIQGSVVYAVGGTVEGAPTSKINYLQRLRELVAIEAEHDQLSVEARAAKHTATIFRKANEHLRSQIAAKDSALRIPCGRPSKDDSACDCCQRRFLRAALGAEPAESLISEGLELGRAYAKRAETVKGPRTEPAEEPKPGLSTGLRQRATLAQALLRDCGPDEDDFDPTPGFDAPETKPNEVECSSCRGYGHFSKWGKPSADRTDRKCLECSGTGEVPEPEPAEEPETK